MADLLERVRMCLSEAGYWWAGRDLALDRNGNITGPADLALHVPSITMWRATQLAHGDENPQPTCYWHYMERNRVRASHPDQVPCDAWRPLLEDCRG